MTATPPPASPPPGGPVTLTTGTASVQLSVGSKKASITVPLDRGQIAQDGTLFAEWNNRGSGNSSTEGLFVNIPGGESKTYKVDINNLYVRFYAEILTSDVERVSCAVVVDPTPTGGVSGTIDCKGRLRVLLDPVTAKGTFAAEP